MAQTCPRLGKCLKHTYYLRCLKSSSDGSTSEYDFSQMVREFLHIFFKYIFIRILFIVTDNDKKNKYTRTRTELSSGNTRF